MADRHDGGPAFPNTSKVHAGYGGESYGGMSLRDYFAGQALVGLLAMPASLDGMGKTDKLIAQYAYAVADAMLAARDARSKPTD